MKDWMKQFYIEFCRPVLNKRIVQINKDDIIIAFTSYPGHRLPTTEIIFMDTRNGRVDTIRKDGIDWAIGLSDALDKMDKEEEC